MGKSKTNKGNANCNQVILDHFWNISDQSEEKRCRSTQVILKTLSGQVASDDAKSDVSYCVDRLIRGLISTRDFARHGFCVLLTQILAQFSEQVDLSDVLSLAEKEYGLKVAEATSEGAISWTLLIGCILKSGRLSADDEELTRQIFDYMLRLGSKKNYVEIIICNLLPVFFAIFTDNPAQFTATVLDSLQEAEKEQKKTVFYAYILFLAKCSFPTEAKEVFSDFFKSSIYRKGSNDYGKVLALLKETTKFHPNVHPFNELLVATFHQRDSEQYSSLISAIVDALFSVNLEKTSLGFEMIRILLKFANSEQVTLILSANFMRLFIQTLSNKKHPLHNSATELGAYFAQLSAEKRDDAAFQVALAHCFINKPGSINFDELSKSKILASITKTFGNEAIQAWILTLKGLMISQEEIPASDFYRLRALQQISQHIKSYTVEDDFLWTVTKFAFVYAYFDVTDSKKILLQEEVKLEKFKAPLSEKLQRQFPDCFKSTFAHLGHVASLAVASQADKKLKQIEVLSAMVDFASTLLTKKKVALIATSETAVEQIKQTIDDLRAKIEQIDALKKATTEANIFKLLHLYFVIELFGSHEEILAIVPDFTECANRSLFVAKKTKKSRKSVSSEAQEPLWADVLTDLVLSLLTTKSKYTKNVIIQAFKHVAPFVSSLGLQSLTEAVLNKDAFNAGDSDDEEEEDEEAMEVDDETAVEKDGDKDEENSSESEDDDDDDEELIDTEEGDVDEQFKMDVIKALGAAVENEDASEDEDAMSDSEMFRIDESLAEVFRRKFGDKKKANERVNLIQAFKHRVLELIQIVVEQKSDMSAQLTLTVLSSTLSVAKAHYAVKNMSAITSKCIQILGLIAKKRFTPGDADAQLEEDAIRKSLTQVLEMQYRCAHGELQKSLVAITSWLLLVTKSAQLTSTELFSASLTRSLRDLFDRPNVELKPELFTRLIPQVCEMQRTSFLKSDLYGILVEYSFSDTLRPFKRASALDILASLVKASDASSGAPQGAVSKLASQSITRLIEQLTKEQTKDADSRLQYVNALIKLALVCKACESENSNTVALLGQLHEKLGSLPKAFRKKLNQMFVKKVKSAVGK